MSLWRCLVRRRRDAAVRRETMREQMSPQERRFADESFEDYQADEFVGDHLGGVEFERELDDEFRG